MKSCSGSVNLVTTTRPIGGGSHRDADLVWLSALAPLVRCGAECGGRAEPRAASWRAGGGRATSPCSTLVTLVGRQPCTTQRAYTCHRPQASCTRSGDLA